MFVQIEKKYKCSECGFDGEPNTYTTSLTNLETVTYFICPQCGHKKEWCRTKRTDGLPVVYEYKPPEYIEY